MFDRMWIFGKIANGFKPLTIIAKTPSQMFDRVLDMLLGRCIVLTLGVGLDSFTWLTVENSE